MNNNLRRISIAGLMLVIIVGMSLALVGCGGGSDKKNERDLGLLKAGVLRIATDADFAPFEQVVTSGGFQTRCGTARVDGISIRIAHEIATELGLGFEVELMEWSAVLLATQTRHADMAVAGMTIREDRRQNMDFTIPWFMAGQVVVVQQGNNTYDSMTYAQIRAAMSGKNVGGVVGQTGALLGEELGAKVQGFTTNAAMLQAVSGGQVELAIMDNVTALTAVKENPSLNLRVVNVPLSNEQYGFGVRRGNAELLYQVNNVMASMFMNGRMDAIFAQFIS